MMSMKTFCAILALALLSTACGGGGSAGGDAAPDTLLSPAETPPDTASLPARDARGRVVFDPARVQVGDTVAGMVLESKDVAQSMPDGEWVGSVRFAGQTTVSGITRAHPDDPDSPALCFELDRESAVRLPRFSGDERIGWFCFDEPAEARRLLGAAPPKKVRASIVIDRFTYSWSHSDVVNEAHLARVVVKQNVRR
jgi:hypothetical protein